MQGSAALLAGQGFHCRAGVVVDEPARSVGIVVWLAAHRQHGPGLYIHHNTHAALGHMVLLHGGGESAFEPVLDLRVDRQRQAVAGHGFLQGLVVGGHVVTPSVFGRQDLAVPAGQFLIVVQLQPPQACVVDIGKAEKPAHKIPLRVDAAGILPDLDAFRVMLLAPVPHGIGHFAADAAAQQAVVRGTHREFLQRFRIVYF